MKFKVIMFTHLNDDDELCLSRSKPNYVTNYLI